MSRLRHIRGTPRKADYYEQERHREAHWADRFAKHQATLETHGPFETLLWAEPGTGNLLVRYIAHAPSARLFASGDVGEATYCRVGTLAQWARFPNLSYFAEKCQASSVGRRAVEWDADSARRNVGELLSHCERGKARVFLTEGGKDALVSRWEWDAWMREYGADVFGCDYWELTPPGEVIAWEIEAHFYGLRMAWAQLAATGVDTGAPGFNVAGVPNESRADLPQAA